MCWLIGLADGLSSNWYQKMFHEMEDFCNFNFGGLTGFVYTKGNLGKSSFKMMIQDAHTIYICSCSSKRIEFLQVPKRKNNFQKDENLF